MTRSNFIALLKASLHDASRVLNAALDADFERITDNALRDFSRPYARPLVKKGSVTLVEDVTEYAPPADFIAMKNPAQWGMFATRSGNPWEEGFQDKPAPLNFGVLQGDAGLVLWPFYTPTSSAISTHGATCEFLYYAAHTLDSNGTTIKDADMDIFLTRAQAEAMTELMARNYAEPASVMGANDEINGSPQQVYSVLMRKYREMLKG